MDWPYGKTANPVRAVLLDAEPGGAEDRDVAPDGVLAHIIASFEFATGIAVGLGEEQEEELEETTAVGVVLGHVGRRSEDS